MLASELVSDVRKELLEITGNFWSNDELLRLINRALAHYSGEVRYGETYAFMSTTDGEAEYTLPSNCLAVKIVMYKEVNDNGDQHWRRLAASTLEEISRIAPDFLDTTTEKLSAPKFYAVWDRKIRLQPVPKDSTSSNLYMFFKTRSGNVVDITKSIPLDESLVEAIHDFVLWKAWMKEKEVQLAQDAKVRYDEGIRRGRRYVKKLGEAVRHRLDIPSNIPFGGSNSYSPLD